MLGDTPVTGLIERLLTTERRAGLAVDGRGGEGLGAAEEEERLGERAGERVGERAGEWEGLRFGVAVVEEDRWCASIVTADVCAFFLA